jgi:hypothetical protein
VANDETHFGELCLPTTGKGVKPIGYEVVGRKSSSLMDKVGLRPGLGPSIKTPCQLESFLQEKGGVTFEGLEDDGGFTESMG